MDLMVSSASSSFQLVVIYRPRPTKENKLSAGMFFEDFPTLLESLSAVGADNLLLTGDFNYHVDVADDREALKFMDILERHNLQQHVHEPTHISLHTLDLLISRKDSSLVSSLTVINSLPSDHFAVTCLVNIIRPGPSTKRIVSRQTRKINKEDFRQDVQSSLDFISCATLDTVVSEYNKNLSNILDKHAPEVERTVILRPHAPWYTESLRIAKQERRRRERKWLKSGLTVDKESYKAQCEYYKSLLTKSKTEFHTNQIAEANQRDLFRVIDKLTSPKVNCTLPEHDSAKDLADSFVQFFNDKIEKLQQKLEATDMPPLSVEINETCTTSFAEFDIVTEEEVLEAIKSASITSCPLDPLPVDIFKQCLPEVLPTITNIVNMSLSSGMFPTALKHARIIPLLKKPTLDANILSNYRPISNLAFLGKVIERIAVQQLQKYLTDNHLHAPMQSAYRPFHSVETALLKVNNDILTSLDKRKEVLLVLLDFSAAFDLIDHEQLLDRLTARYGVKGNVWRWFSSYLSNRTQSVAVGDVLSDPVDLKCGVPQGSVAGPLAFTMFSAPLQAIIEQHGISSVVYADDTQLYVSFSPRDRQQAVKKIEACIADVRIWCEQNKLALNDSKTELVYFTSKFTESSWIPSVKIGDSTIHPSQHARNLGVTMDSTLAMKSHVDNLCKGALFGIRKIGQIRHYLSQDTTVKLVHAFVTSKLDSCNSLLFGLQEQDIMKVQQVQNTAARLVLRVPRHEHITPALEELHWLPVRQRINYKILLMTYKALNGMAPEFISDLIQLYVPTRSLRSSSGSHLEVPCSVTKFYGERAYASAAAHLWNTLPNNICQAPSLTIFKSLLKTHLFRQHFLH